MRWRGLTLLLPLALVCAPRVARATLCGDNVAGQDVPCACGDVVVSDVVLGASDPVTQGVCTGDGLTVRANGAAHGVTVDVAGQHLRGAGQGTGLLVLYGGPGGARVISSGGTGTIEGFQDGIAARGDESLGVLDGLVAQSNARDGVQINASSYEVRNTVSQDSGRDGFVVGGKTFLVEATRATHSGRTGYAVSGNDGTLAGPVAESSGAEGFHVWGMGHHVLDCSATGSGKSGVELYGMHTEMRRCTATGNGGDGIHAMGMDITVAGNSATDNDGNGLLLVGAWGHDERGNRGSGNRGLHQQGPAIQCQVSGWPCRW